jgi:hypothetical protein
MDQIGRNANAMNASQDRAALIAKATAELRGADPDLDEKIRADVAKWPPLTAEKRAALALLLQPEGEHWPG